MRICHRLLHCTNPALHLLPLLKQVQAELQVLHHFVASLFFMPSQLVSHSWLPALASHHSCSNLVLKVRLVVFVFSCFTYPTSLLGVQALLTQQCLRGSATRRGTESEPRSGWHSCACSSWPPLTRQSASGRSLFLNPLLSVFFRPLFSCTPKQTIPKPRPGCTC